VEWRCGGPSECLERVLNEDDTTLGEEGQVLGRKDSDSR
jgi:hypothetical protein